MNMWRRDRHYTDEELLRAADGELPPREYAGAEAHLAVCESCRSRFEHMKRTAEDFVQAYRRETDTIPSPGDPRARLQALLHERGEESERSLAPEAESLAAWTWVYASVGVLIACLAFYLFHFDRRIAAKAMGASSNYVLLVPIPTLTPGVARPISARQACVAAPLDQMASIPLAVQQRVFQEYGMGDGQRRQYEVDHLITPELGGTDDIKNLWPEPYSSEWNARVKDQLEDHLRELVCAGKLDVKTAQREIATDWISAYKRYFRTDTPRPDSQS
jgi:Putative zinc-finger